MRTRAFSWWPLAAALWVLGAGQGCNLLNGLDDVTYKSGGSGGGTSSGGGGAGGGANVCGDSVVGDQEGCDDGNTTNADGCASACTVEGGWSCDGTPSVCTVTCGNGTLQASETCDDANVDNGDGCSVSCAIETGWSCDGEPSVCMTGCGDGVIAGTEACDDDNEVNSDGCSAACAIEEGWDCTGQPSACVTTCGDGKVAGAEACDDTDTDSGDGCSATCTVETGWSCDGMPSVCTTGCGDGIVAGSEECDDDNPTDADGCSSECVVEDGWDCTGEPSACLGICGDGTSVGTEGCDDGDTDAGDGCSAMCSIEAGWSCDGEPSVCMTGCGDGVVAGVEGCDDDDNSSGDGCSAACAVETGYSCTGSPSVCADNNECMLGTDNCSAGATCANTPGSFTCTCNGGYTGNGVNCQDLNECANNTDNCSADANCMNTPGSFTCMCKDGFTGDGLLCTDIDECQLGTDNCPASSQCTNTPGSFTCSDDNECQLGTDNCDANATCADILGGFTCTCNPGYGGDGVTCADIDECVLGTDNCDANATCTNSPGSFSCACDTGYVGDGVTCSPVGTLAFSAARYNGSEGAMVMVDVVRTGGSAGAIQVDFATADGVAVAGTDYTSNAGTLSFADGVTTQSFMVTLSDDAVEEGPKALALALTNPGGGASLGAQATASLTIRDNDAVLLGLTQSQNLVRFSSGAPGTILSTTALTGLPAGVTLVGIDHRPNNGVLYGLGSNELLYVVNASTGAVTSQSPTALALSGTAFGIDFNPTVDRIRVVSDAEQNLRLTGAAVKITDGVLAFAAGDANVGADPNVAGAAYTNSFAGAITTTLYNIDSNLDILVTQLPPNAGTLNTIGALGFDTTDQVGFDISSTGTALASLHASGATESKLVHVDLPTGSIFDVGTVAAGSPLVGLTIVPPAPPVQNRIFGVTMGNTLVRFDTAAPDTLLTNVAITGLMGAEQIVGIDFRPSDGQLYALTDADRIYTVNLTTGAALQVGADASFDVMGAAFGFDFNPVPDRIRSVSDLAQNLRLNPFDGTLGVTDGVLAFEAADINFGATPFVAGAAYTNSFPGTTSTTLYDIDFDLDVLVMQNPPNAGTLLTVGALGFNTDDRVAFDISRLNQAFASLTAPAATDSILFTIDLTTGTATQVDIIGGGAPLVAMSIAPAGTP